MDPVTELEELRAEHAESVIGPRIARLLARVVRATAPTYPAREYTASGRWDVGTLEDVLHDWVEVRLLRRGDLAVILGSARTTAGVNSLLTRSFTQHLINKRRRTSATNLFDRVGKMLRSGEEFHQVLTGPTGGDAAYCPAAKPSTEPASTDSVRALVKMMAAISDEELQVVRYGPYSLKSSPILRDPKLRQVLLMLLTEADGYLTLSQAVAIMVHRFNLVEPDPTTLEEAAVDTRADTSTTAETLILARSVLSRLGREQALLLRLLADADGDPAAAARAAGTSQAQFTEVADTLHALIADHAETPTEAAAVFRTVVESLYGADEQP
jgi:hypothetical protein